MAEDDGEADGGDDTCSKTQLRLLSGNRDQKVGGTYARPMEKMKQRSNFFFTCSCRCQITGIGIRNIQISVMRFEMLVKYVNVTRSRHFPFTSLSQ